MYVYSVQYSFMAHRCVYIFNISVAPWNAQKQNRESNEGYSKNMEKNDKFGWRIGINK